MTTAGPLRFGRGTGQTTPPMPYLMPYHVHGRGREQTPVHGNRNKHDAAARR